ncbi:uncharacterized protein igsf9b isoform 1-T4 [Synchiropus picturatus]
MGLETRGLQAVITALCICQLCVSQGVSTLVRAREGSSAELGCNLSPLSEEATTPNIFPLHVVEWVRLGYNVPILIKFGVYAPRVHPNYKGRVSLTRGASLLVERLTLEDEGWFECRILLLDSKTDNFQNGTWTFLSITAPPVFIKKPPTFVEVLLGESLTLSCGAHGNPRPTVVWHKDETPIEKHEKIKVLNGTLSLASITRNVSGVYKCHVSNSEGNLTHYTQLQVKGPPIIIISPEDTTLNMSQDAVLQCQADAYPSNLTYEWMKQGQNVYHIESLKSRVKVLVDGTLLIPNLIPEDAGNYTCIPTNGILTPPSASAHLKVKHPARVGRMPRETFLPSGMEGVIICPIQADPPVLYVNWTKDGNEFNPENIPGWMVNSEGSVFIARANDNAVGMYTCTPYNSYGTMGQSEPTKVVLKDPPAFLVPPRAEYLQEVGRTLIVPCEATGDPAPNITWSKIGPTPRSPFSVLANGSLLLQPLSKDHHGGWECLASNRVATVSAGTVVMVLGTSPHAVSSVAVTTEMNQANVSWVPGFDGGYTQKFTVWVKQASGGKHEWASLPVPTSKTYLLVTGLVPATSYQFSVLPQNKLGSGAFSEIVSVRTQAVATETPTAVTSMPYLEPPLLLEVNRTGQGVLLQWLPPEEPTFPLTGFVLQARRNQGQWLILNNNIEANQSELLIQGLVRDSSYDLRLMSRSNKVLSEPSDSLSVSTEGMMVYPLQPSFLEMVPEHLLAGLLGGVCFLFIAIVLSLVTACYMSNRRARRRRKRRDLLPGFQKTPSQQTGSPPPSPDSVLKLKLCPPLPFFPSSSFERSNRGEYQDQRKQLISNSSPPPHYTLFESHLGSQAPSPTALESISRGPDGRFIVQPLLERCSSFKKNGLQSNGGASGSGSNRTSFRDSPKSSILSSEKDRKDSPLSRASEQGESPSSPARVQSVARHFSRHGCFYSDEEQGSEGLLERASFYSDNSEKKPSDSSRKHRALLNTEDILSHLGRRFKHQDKDKEYQPMQSEVTNNSAMVTDLERSGPTCDRTENSQDTTVEEEPVWKLQDVTIRQKHRASGQSSRVADYRRACYFSSSSSSPMNRLPNTHVQWDISPITSDTSHVPSQAPHSGRLTSESSLSVGQSALTQNTSLPCPDGTSGSLDDTQSRARWFSPGRGSGMCRRSMTEEGLREKHQGFNAASRSRSSYAYGTQAWDSWSTLILRDRSRAPDLYSPQTSSQDPSPSGYATLPYDQQGDQEAETCDERRSSDLEKEGVRTRSRKSVKCLFSDAASPVTTLTLVEEAESDQSQFSVPRTSESFKVKPPAPSPKMSPLQTSAILEYLSLPGFIEMSVDEPTEEAEVTEPRGSDPTPDTSLESGVAPDVVPKNWEVHIEEIEGVDSDQTEELVEGENFDASDTERRSGEVRDSLPRVWFPDDVRAPSPGPEKTCKQLYDEKTRIRSESRLGSGPAHALFGAARSMADIMTKHSQSFVAPRAPSPDPTQRPPSQGGRTNNIASRICQAPVPFLKKSFSMGPSRTFSGHPRPFIKKSMSLGYQRWEHFENPRTYVSEKCYWDELPTPDVMVKSYSLGRTPSSFPRPGPSWREYVPLRRPSVGSLERPYQTQRSLATLSYLTPQMYPPRPASVSPLLEPSDPRRQATVFPESSRWSPYEDPPRSVPYCYVPAPPPIPVPPCQPWPGPRAESLRFVDTRRGPPRSYLPRGISWPSPYYPPFVPREGESYRPIMGRVAEPELRDGGRASYASQSSGRGSAGLFRQSLSVTPTLLSSPETTEESERHRAEMEQHERRANRRNTSVDESYEWDVGVDPEVLEAMRLDQAHGLQDQHCKGPPACPPASGRCLRRPSLSEERFNALRLEYQQYRRAQESVWAREPCHTSGHDSDSDANSALL